MTHEPNILTKKNSDALADRAITVAAGVSGVAVGGAITGGATLAGVMVAALAGASVMQVAGDAEVVEKAAQGVVALTALGGLAISITPVLNTYKNVERSLSNARVAAYHRKADGVGANRATFNVLEMPAKSVKLAGEILNRMIPGAGDRMLMDAEAIIAVEGENGQSFSIWSASPDGKKIGRPVIKDKKGYDEFRKKMDAKDTLVCHLKVEDGMRIVSRTVRGESDCGGTGLPVFFKTPVHDYDTRETVAEYSDRGLDPRPDTEFETQPYPHWKFA